VMLEIPDPDATPESARRARRVAFEYAAFDAERYLGDFFGAEYDPVYEEALRFVPFWVEQWDAWKAGTVTAGTATSPKDAAFDAVGGFSKDEQEVLRTGLRSREYLVAADSAEERSLLLGLADILFAFCHEWRMTGGEPSVESATNVARLSPTFSWLDRFAEMEEDEEETGDNVGTVIAHCARRSLVYPYLRHWKLTRKTLADVCRVLLLGRRCVLKCLLRLRAVLGRSDCHFALNKLYVDDYCVWVQRQLREEALQAFAARFNDAKNAFEAGADRGKERVELNLPALEAWAEKRVGNDDDEDNDEEEDDDDDRGAGEGAGASIPARLLPRPPQLPSSTNPPDPPPLSPAAAAVAVLLKPTQGEGKGTRPPLIVELPSPSPSDVK